eukprot:TRINITY_DN79_c3_g3_i2.p1 TRINITY_DN79_c3_g3~~TRINITY_DN79_c3_g3_i2.p1  ORF type:complete len:427 (+),score=178.02 TRINITY_DN79_c3_g3_i2:149-1429(+)
MDERKRLFSELPTPGQTYQNNSEQTQQGQQDQQPIQIYSTFETPYLNNENENENGNVVNLAEKGNKESLQEAISTGSLLLLGLLGLGVAIVYLDFILIPLIFSRFLIYIFQPMINLFVGKKPWPLCKLKLCFPRWLAVIIVFLLICGIVFLFSFVIVISVRDVVNDKDLYIQRMDALYNSTIDYAASLGYEKTELEGLLPEIDLGAIALSIFNSLLNLLPNMFLILLFTLYMLLDYNEKQNKTELRRNVDIQIRSYIVIHSAISALTGVLTAIIFLLLGVNLALIYGLLAFLLNFIPNIGSLLAVAIPMPFVILDPGSTFTIILLAFLLPITIQCIIGNVIEPKILGDSMEMPPITVLVALMFWGYFWGILGAILSVPLTTTIRLYLQSYDHPAPQILAGMLVGDFSFLDASRKKDDIPPNEENTK